MTTDPEALVIAGYVFADEYPVPARPGRPAKVSDAELVAVAVCQVAMGISSDRPFLGARRAGAARLVSAPARAVAVQPAPAPARRAARRRAAAARPLARRRRRPARRRDADRGCQLPGLRLLQRLRRCRPLGLRQAAAPLRLRPQARARGRLARATARLHVHPRQREGVRGNRRSAHRHRGRAARRRQAVSGVVPTASGSQAPARRCSRRRRNARPPTSAASARSRPAGS
jgi:hypothetical protein